MEEPAAVSDFRPAAVPDAVPTGSAPAATDPSEGTALLGSTRDATLAMLAGTAFDVASLAIVPASPDRWPDVERLFGPRGACGGCWCMWPRLRGTDFNRLKGQPNRLAFQALVEGGSEPGVLAYAAGQPAGWCAVAPRAAYPRLGRGLTLPDSLEPGVWSIVCLFVARPYRRKGLSVALIQAAVDLAAAHGARLVEAYPVEPRTANVPAAFAWMGLAAAYQHAGFGEAGRPTGKRPVLRRVLH